MCIAALPATVTASQSKHILPHIGEEELIQSSQSRKKIGLCTTSQDTLSSCGLRRGLGRTIQPSQNCTVPQTNTVISDEKSTLIIKLSSKQLPDLESHVTAGDREPRQ